MSPDAFLQLCEKLRATRQVRDTKHVTVEEQVARFLYIIAHNVKTRTVSFFYHRSGETVSCHFHAVLQTIILLEDEFLRQPSTSIISPAILHDHRFYPYFKFTYVLTGWEGTASDSKVLKNVLSRDDNLKLPRDPDPHLIVQVDRELQENNPEEDEVVRHEQDEDYRRGAILRDEIAAQMWADYQLGL
ncbi:uncharacterized protein [Arachis hypogaea]|uniref:uncharacterized protein n=1 Tax=Arachis hypogaea TaxID=3818 RepID=UPI003B219825